MLTETRGRSGRQHRLRAPPLPAAWRTGALAPAYPVTAIARDEARRLARTVLEHSQLLRRNNAMLRELVDLTPPGLQEVPGIGPVTAAICVYSHRGRIRSEAAFAALAGIAPRRILKRYVRRAIFRHLEAIMTGTVRTTVDLVLIDTPSVSLAGRFDHDRNTGARDR